MPTIRILPDILASQVAAGEVVERPSSVVKELVENSIDAQAREILVEIERGGTALIRVTDDGSGMERDDALLSLERHATSKLRLSSDLNAIATLGFRGEAVPSIASVSRFRLITRERSQIAGTEIIVDGGKVKDVRDAGAAPGTSIEVRQLFFNIPARRKFLKAESTEASHVEHEVRLHALAAETVRFRYRRDGADIFDLPAVAGKGDRLRHLLGVDTASELIEVHSFLGNGFSVEGFLLPAVHARKGRRHQCVFLNGRPIEDAAIARGLVEGFKGGLMEGMHPAAWLWLEMEPHLVDVNVHPAKREVRFHRPLDVRDGVAQAVMQAWQPVVKNSSPTQSSPPPSPPIVEMPGRVKSFIPQASTPTIIQPASIAAPSRSWLSHATQQQLPIEESSSSVAAPALPKRGAAAFRFIGIVSARFIVLESADGLVLFDPRAARERIVYEQMMQAEKKGVDTQGLLVPVLLEMDPREKDLVLRYRDRFVAAGLDLGEFGGGTMQLRSFPACLRIADPREFLHEVIDELLAGGSGSAQMAFERLAKALAKRAGKEQLANEDTAMPLLDELFTCDLPYCAADGRPTLTEFSIRELERRFGCKS